MFLIWFLFLSDFGSRDGFEVSNTWASNECPPIPPCQACPCPQAKLCPSCNNGFPGYNKYGPSGIVYRAQPGTYTCPGTKQDGYCVVDAQNALSTCNSDPKCLGFLQFNENDTTRMLISGTPANYGKPNGTVYFEKMGNRPPSSSNNLQTIAFASGKATFYGSNNFPGVSSGMNVRITIDQITSTTTQNVIDVVAAMNNQVVKVANVQADGGVVVNGNFPSFMNGQSVGVLGNVLTA